MLLVAIGSSTKVIAFIALLPSVFALLIGLITLIAVKWRNSFHIIIKSICIRLIEKNPFMVVMAIIAFITGLIQIAAKCIHFLGFL